MANGQLSYDFSGVLNHVQFQLGFVYLSDFYFDQYENPYIKQQGYTLWHSRLSYQPMPQFEVSVFGKNLLNKEYTELKFDSIAALAAVTELRGEARQLGVGVTYQF
jgi:iron complex outermembrane receptor protein